MAANNQYYRRKDNLASRMEGQHPLSLDEIKEIRASRKIDLDARNKKGQTILMIACIRADEEMVRYLLEIGADPNARCSKSGNTPLHYASLTKQCKCLEEGLCEMYSLYPEDDTRDRKAIITLLINHGSTLQTNSQGLNPPCLAALHLVSDIVKFFVEKAANMSGFKMSMVEKVEAYKALAVCIGIGNYRAYSLLDTFKFEGRPYSSLCRAVALSEKSDVPSSVSQVEKSEIAAHFSLFSTSGCKTSKELAEVRPNPWAVAVQCFIVADEVLPQGMKKSYIVPRLLTLCMDGIFDYKESEEKEELLSQASKIVREAIQWEGDSKINLGVVLTVVLRTLYSRVRFARVPYTRDNLSVNECIQLMDLCLQVLNQAPMSSKVDTSLLSPLASVMFLIARSDRCKSAELFESLLQFGESIIKAVRSRCKNVPSVSHYILSDIEGFVNDGKSKNRKYKENRVKILISRMLKCEDASEVDEDGKSMLHTLAAIDFYEDLRFPIEIAQMLIQHGCRTEARDREGRTAAGILSNNEFFDEDLDPSDSEEFLALVSSPTSVSNLEEIAAKAVAKHQIPCEGILPIHLSACVTAQETESELFPPSDLDETSSSSSWNEILDC